MDILDEPVTKGQLIDALTDIADAIETMETATLRSTITSLGIKWCEKCDVNLDTIGGSGRCEGGLLCPHGYGVVEDD